MKSSTTLSIPQQKTVVGLSTPQTRRNSATIDGAFYCLYVFMAGCIGTFGWPLSLCGSANLYSLPPFTFSTVGGSPSSYKETANV